MVAHAFPKMVKTVFPNSASTCVCLMKRFITPNIASSISSDCRNWLSLLKNPTRHLITVVRVVFVFIFINSFIIWLSLLYSMASIWSKTLLTSFAIRDNHSRVQIRGRINSGPVKHLKEVITWLHKHFGPKFLVHWLSHRNWWSSMWLPPSKTLLDQKS